MFLCVCRRGGHWEPYESQSIGAEEPLAPHPEREGVWGGAQRWVHLPQQQQQPILQRLIFFTHCLLGSFLWQSESWMPVSVPPSPSITWATWVPPRAREPGSASWRVTWKWWDFTLRRSEEEGNTLERPSKSCRAFESVVGLQVPWGGAKGVTQWSCSSTDNKEVITSTCVSCSWSTGCLWRIPVRWPWWCWLGLGVNSLCWMKTRGLITELGPIVTNIWGFWGIIQSWTNCDLHERLDVWFMCCRLNTGCLWRTLWRW